MRPSRAVPSLLAFAALTTISATAQAQHLTTEERHVVDAPPVADATTTPSPATPPVATNPSMTPERPTETPSPQSPDDGEIEYRLMVRMASLDPVRLGDVHVRSVRGAVTLYGSVPDARSRDRALIMANTFDGVRVVRDELDLRPRGSSARGGGPTDDATVSANATQALRTDPGVVGQPLDVRAERGVLTLRGTVATYADARRILSTAKSIPGVVAVRPALRVNEAHVVLVDGDRNARRTR
jgi:hyperosmotically inducible protein